MIRLVLLDLRDHVSTWVGAFVLAVGCGYIGGWVVSIQTTASSCGEDMYKVVQNAGSMMLVFSLVAAVAVLVSAANLTVSSQQRSYALWQLANVSPRLVSGVVLAQLVVVAILGAACGTMLAAITFIPLFPWVFGSRESFAQVVPFVGVSLMPKVWFVVAGVFVVGGIKGARSAGRTPPLTILREPEPPRRGMTLLRVLLFLGLAACTYWVAAIMVDFGPAVAMDWALYVPILVVATLSPIAPLVFSMLLRAWTAFVPYGRWNAWYLARHTASYSLSTSTSIQTPIMVGFGLVAGLFSVTNAWALYAQNQGLTGFTGLDLTTTILMLGGPVLLCALGAAVSVVMSSQSRTRDVALLTASGARPATLMAAAVCEAFMHALTATVVGAGSAVISHGIFAHAVGLPVFAGVAFGEGLIVSLVGFVLVLVATVIPTYAALTQETATVLAQRD